MGIKYNRELKHYVVSYHRRHPITKKTKTIRRQGIKTKVEAERVYKKLIILMGEKMNEVLYSYWLEVVNQFLVSFMNRGIAKNTLINYESTLKAHTFKKWEKRHINEITTTEIRDLILEDMGHYSESHKKSMLKHIRAVFKYAVDSDIINRDPTPKINFKVGEKIKLALKENEVKTLLREARDRDNRWFPIWALARFTGMRNGELYALKWEDVDLDNQVITVQRSYNKRENTFKSTKAGYWRTVPISGELMTLILELKQSSKSEFVLPRLVMWRKGYQAKILKAFCKSIGLPEIKFHTLRACFATQLIGSGVEPIKVMKICGWKDLKTMSYYLRLSGIDEKGVTEGLNFLPKSKVIF